MTATMTEVTRSFEANPFNLVNFVDKSSTAATVEWLSPQLRSVLEQDMARPLVHASSELVFALRTCWLFTYTDIKSNIVPSTLFAIMTALSICLRIRSTAEPYEILVMVAQVLMSTPVVLGWVYLNNLPFSFCNQVSASAIQEDSINKPWRPIPAGRISAETVARLIVPGYLVALTYSYLINNTMAALVLIFLGWCYNSSSINGSENWALRTLLNAFGFPAFLYGALQASLFHVGAQDGSGPLSAWATMKWWLVTLGCIIFVTVHVLDMYDQEGDQARGRLTLPLVIGDVAARRILALASVASSIGSCYIWDCCGRAGIMTMSFGTLVAVGTMSSKSAKADKKVAIIWSMWLMSLYTLPLVQALS